MSNISLLQINLKEPSQYVESIVTLLNKENNQIKENADNMLSVVEKTQINLADNIKFLSDIQSQIKTLNSYQQTDEINSSISKLNVESNRIKSLVETQSKKLDINRKIWSQNKDNLILQLNIIQKSILSYIDSAKNNINTITKNLETIEKTEEESEHDPPENLQQDSELDSISETESIPHNLDDQHESSVSSDDLPCEKCNKLVCNCSDDT